MKGILSFLSVIFLLGCVPLNKEVVKAQKAGCCGPNVPEVSVLVATQKEIKIRGINLDEIVRVKFKNEEFDKSFKIKSRSYQELVLEAIDMLAMPVDVAMEMVLSSAFADNSFPIIFSLQPDAVAAINIQNGAATRLKINKEPGDNPSEGDVLAWDKASNTFKFAPNDNGDGGGQGGAPIKICRIEFRMVDGESEPILVGTNDVPWDSGGPYGSDCSWLSYGTQTLDGGFSSSRRFFEFTLTSGTYFIDAWTAFQRCGNSWIDIYNVTENRQELQGSTHYSAQNREVDAHYTAKTTVNISANTTFKIRSFASENRCTTSVGLVGNTHELNGQIVIWKFN